MDRRILATRLLHARVVPGGREGRGASLPEWDGGGAQLGRGLRAGWRSPARPLSAPGCTPGQTPCSGAAASRTAPRSQATGPGGLCGAAPRRGSALRALANALRELAGLRNLTSLGRLQFDFSFQSVSSPPGCTGRSTRGTRAPGSRSPSTRLPAQPQRGARPLCWRSASFRSASLRSCSPALGCPGVRREGSAAAATAGLSLRNPSPDSRLRNRPEPPPRALGPAPLLCIRPMSTGLAGGRAASPSPMTHYL